MRIGRNFTGNYAGHNAAITAKALEGLGFDNVQATSLTRLNWFVSATAPQGMSNESALRIAKEVNPDGTHGLWNILDSR